MDKLGHNDPDLDRSKPKREWITEDQLEPYPDNPDDKLYPCDDCGVMRSANEGGLTFTVCDKCWDKHFIKIDGDVYRG